MLRKVIQDTREKQPWKFSKNKEWCGGTVVKKLDEGDYSIEGMEDRIIIERKRSTSELVHNFTEKRFWRELERLNLVEYPFLIAEFSLVDLHQFPVNSGIPSYLWPRIRLGAGFAIKKFNEMVEDYKISVIFAGNNGKTKAAEILKDFALGKI